MSETKFKKSGEKYLRVSTNLASGGPAIHHERMAEPRMTTVRITTEQSRLENKLLATVSNSDDPLALSVPFEVVAMKG